MKKVFGGMYHVHFGLTRGLFGEGIAINEAVFRSPRHEELVDRYGLAFGSTSSALVLRGPPGVGKTTLTAAALRATSTRLALAWINGVPTNGTELLELILVELGIGTLNTTRIERLQLWRQLQGELRATDSRLFVVVERTEDLSPEVLHALDQLTAPDVAGNLGANLVLLGHETIDNHLAAPLLDSLCQRIRVRADLAPFSEAELNDYLRHQVGCANGNFERIFAPGAVAALHRYSGGVPRLVNTLCETALDVAAAERHERLTPELVERTAGAVLGLTATPDEHEETPEPNTAPTPAPAKSTAPASPAVAPKPPSATLEPVAAVATAPAPEPVWAARLQQAVAPPPVSVSVTLAPASVTVTPKPAEQATPRPAGIEAAPTMAAAPNAPATETPKAVQVAPAAPRPAAAAPSAPPPRAAAAAPSPPAALASAAPPKPAIAAAASTPPPSAASLPKATATPASPPPPVLDAEFDGGVTDVSDVALIDFPVLTDAVDPFEVTAPIKSAAAPPAAAAAVAVPKSAPKPASRIETAYVSARSSTKAASPAGPAMSPPTSTPPVPAPATTDSTKPASPAAPTAPAAVAPPSPTPLPDPESEDGLRQTQTMRAISVAKSIDDISSSMAETLFADAELDLLTAALASAADWSEEAALEPTAEAPSSPTPKPAPTQSSPAPSSKRESVKTALADDDPFDLFGLGNDAPLELIDDSTLPPANHPRRTAAS